MDSRDAGRVDRIDRPTLVLLLWLLAAVAVASLDQTIVSASLPTIAGAFHRTDLYGWVITAYLLGETAATPVFGKAGDVHGRRIVLQVALALFLVGTVACTAAPTMWSLIVSRGVQGAGAGGIAAAVIGAVADVVPARQRGRLQGLYVSVFALAALIGPVVGGFFVSGPGWRWSFAVSVPPAVACMVVVARRLAPGRPPDAGSIDWWSSVLLVGAICSGVLAFTRVASDGAWGGGAVAAELALAASLAVVFAARQRGADEAFIPSELFTNPVFALSAGLAFVTGLLMFGALAFLPQYLQIARERPATEAGLMLTPVLAGALTWSTVTGRLVARWGRYKIFAVAGMGCLCLGIGLLTGLSRTTPYAPMVVPLVLVGSGVGLSTPVLFLAAQNAVPTRHVGAASATITLLRALGGAVGAAAFGALLVSRIGSTLERTLPGWSGSVNEIIGDPHDVAAQPAATGQAVREALASGTATVLRTALPLAAAALLASLFLREVPLDDGEEEAVHDDQRTA